MQASQLSPHVEYIIFKNQSLINNSQKEAFDMLNIVYDQKQTPGKPLKNRTKANPQKYLFFGFRVF